MKKHIHIGARRVGYAEPVFIIAEAGVNHNGSLGRAKKMVDFAKAAGADAVKFQTFKAEELSVPGPHFEMLKRLQLSNPEFKEIFDYCKKKKIMFLSTPFDSPSAKFLYGLGVPAFKISSGDLTNIPMLLEIARYKKPIILSTGMSDLPEIKDAIDAVYSTGNRGLVLLHCTSSYPALYKDANLKAMATLRNNFKVPVGYSDHTEGIEVSVAAAAMGACVIEKHFTLNKTLPGPDHKISLEPDELKNLVQSVRNIEKAMGSGIKSPRKSEMEIKKAARKSVVAARDIKKGAKLTLDAVAVKRPATGIEPKYMDKIVGRHIKSDIKKDSVLTWDVLT